MLRFGCTVFGTHDDFRIQNQRHSAATENSSSSRIVGIGSMCENCELMDDLKTWQHTSSCLQEGVQLLIVIMKNGLTVTTGVVIAN